jgi:hypothetical protein
MSLCGCSQQGDTDASPSIGHLESDASAIHNATGVISSTGQAGAGLYRVPGGEIFQGVVPGAGSAGKVGDNVDTQHIDKITNGVASDRDERLLNKSDPDYVAKADVYWMLNWIRKAIRTSPLPLNLPEAIEKARKKLEETERDEDYQTGTEAIAHLEQGLKFWRDAQKLEAAHIHRALIPWGAGSLTMQQFIDNGGLGFGAKRKDAGLNSLSHAEDDEDDDTSSASAGDFSASAANALTQPQQDAIAIVLDYEKRYHNAPTQMMLREWKAALEKIDLLRDSLDLRHRAENSDEDNSELNPSPAQNSADIGVNGVVPVPTIGDTASDVNKPVAGVP